MTSRLRREWLDFIINHANFRLTLHKGDTAAMTFRTPVLLVALVVLVMGLSACNTIRGVGQDVENLGESITNAGSK